MIDLGYDYYPIKFNYIDTYSKIILQVPWFIGAQYLTVRQWSPDSTQPQHTLTYRLFGFVYRNYPLNITIYKSYIKLER